MGLVSAFVAEYAGTSGSGIIYLCASLYIVMVRSFPFQSGRLQRADTWLSGCRGNCDAV